MLQIPISKLLTTRFLPKGMHESAKYRRIAACVALWGPESIKRRDRRRNRREGRIKGSGGSGGEPARSPLGQPS